MGTQLQKKIQTPTENISVKLDRGANIFLFLNI